MSVIAGSSGATPVYRAKYAVAQTSLLAIASAFEIASKSCKEIQEDVATLPEGFVFCMGVLPQGPNIYIQKLGNRVIFLGTGDQEADVKILFKNMESALMLFTGQIGTPTAACQKRFITYGNLTEAMIISRCLDWVTAFMFPKIILKKMFKRVPKFTAAHWITKGRVLASIAPALVINAWK